ncbi:hypothetical protein BO99DRAFT_466920, partial [Aspergillus violaceofuscus CBS 115571]
LLSRHDLVRTPEKQRTLLFEKSQPSTLQPTQFSRHVKRGLAGCLALCPRTHDLSIEYVSGGDTDVTILFNSNTRCLKIHEKYLRPDTAHELAPCFAYTMSHADHENSGPFFCDHIVEELYEQTLEQVIDPPDPVLVRSLRLAARDSLQLMPRMTSVAL